MASQNIARLGVVLGLDTAEFTASIDKAISENAKLKNAIRRDTNSAAGELKTLIHATEDYGKALTKVELIQREVTSGKFMNATKDMKDRLLQQAAAYDKIAMSAKNAAGATFKMNEQQKINLTYQTTDFFTQIASGQSPFIAAIQQGGQLKDTMGGVGNMFKAIGSLFTPFSVGLGTVALGLGAVGLAAYQSSEDIAKLKDALTLSGNYSGMTQESFVKLANTLSGQTRSSIADAKEALLGLISSGQFTEQSIGAVSKAIVTYAEIAGVSATEATQKLKGGLSGTAEGAKALNKEMNFLTLEQYKQIEALEKAGKRQEAAQLVAVALNTKLEQQRRELGLLEGAWNKLTKATSNYWDTFKSLLAGPTQSDTMMALDKQIESIKQRLAGKDNEDNGFVRGLRKVLESLQASKENILEIQRLQNRSTSAKDVGTAKGKIDEYDKYKGMLATKAGELAKSQSLTELAIAKQNKHELIQLDLDMKHQLAEANREMLEKNKQEDGRATSQNLEIYKNKAIAIAIETSKKQNDIKTKYALLQLAEDQKIEDEKNLAFVARDKANEAIRTASQAQTRELEFQRESLELKYQMIYATETEQRLAQISLEYARKRKEAESSPERDFLMGQLERQEAMAKLFATMDESAKRTQQVFDSVFGNLTSAIDNFVKTGKLNIKDLARSVIQDLIAIQMKAAAMKFLNSAFSAMSGATSTSSYSASGGIAEHVFNPLTRAAGGSVTNDTPYLVGERGPELFVPSGSGTIIPNGQVGGMGGQTINYNGPIIQNMNAIDTQSGLQFLAKNKQGVFAAYQSANRSIPMSR
jgi:lambda family phage tail tape measure protein